MTEVLLPEGFSTFTDLRTQEGFYIDKTEHLQALTEQSRAVFFRRPKQFGKSLLVSTLASLFKYGLRDFVGLAIEKTWTHTRTYTVIAMDFAKLPEVDTADAFEKAFEDYILDLCRPYGFTYKGFETFKLFALDSWLSQQPNRSVVFLIDNYDVPLLRSKHDKALFKCIGNTLNEFFAILKSCNSAIRFLFLTGITRFEKWHRCAALNYVCDLTYESRLATIAGFTEDELKDHFADDLAAAAKVHGLTVPQLIDQLRDYYGHHCFDGSCQSKVFAPTSIFKFFASKDYAFRPYWALCDDTIEPLVSDCRVCRWGGAFPFLKPVPIEPNMRFLSAEPDQNWDVPAYLFQSGYLTIQETLGDSAVMLGYPNREVTSTMAKLSVDVLVNDSAFKIADLKTALTTGDVPALVKHLNLALSHWCPQLPINTFDALLGAMQIFFLSLTDDHEINVVTTNASPDIYLTVNSHHWHFLLLFGNVKPHTNTPLDTEKEGQHNAEPNMATPHLHSISLTLNYDSETHQAHVLHGHTA